MKVSVSLSDSDVRLLDDLAAQRGTSRSAVLQDAVALLRVQQLGHDYADAWTEWTEGDGRLWEATSADGIEGS